MSASKQFHRHPKQSEYWLWLFPPHNFEAFTTFKTRKAKRFKIKAVCSFVWPEKHISVREQPKDTQKRFVLNSLSVMNTYKLVADIF